MSGFNLYVKKQRYINAIPIVHANLSWIVNEKGFSDAIPGDVYWENIGDDTCGVMPGSRFFALFEPAENELVVIET